MYLIKVKAIIGGEFLGDVLQDWRTLDSRYGIQNEHPTNHPFFNE